MHQTNQRHAVADRKSHEIAAVGHRQKLDQLAAPVLDTLPLLPAGLSLNWHSLCALSRAPWMLSLQQATEAHCGCLQVGSGLGSSAVQWGQVVKENDGIVLAVDSWVGDLSSWFSEAWREAMAWQDGRTQAYERFLNRIVQHKLTNQVLPLRVQSTTAARMLYTLNYTIDAIYLDAAQVRPGLQGKGIELGRLHI